MLVCGILVGWLMFAQPPTEPQIGPIYGTIPKALRDSGWSDFLNIQREVMPEWYCRLENPARALGFDVMSARALGFDVMHEFYSGAVGKVVQRANEVQEQVEAIVAEVDIWNIDLRVDGIGTRMVRGLRESSDGSSLGTSPACTLAEDGEPNRDTVNRDREDCVCFLDREKAESAVRQLEDTEEGVESDSLLWEEVEKRIRDMMRIGLKDGKTLLENPGLRTDLVLLSTRDQRPFRTFMLRETGEKIEIWIATHPICKSVRATVKWTNLEDG